MKRWLLVSFLLVLAFTTLAGSAWAAGGVVRYGDTAAALPESLGERGSFVCNGDFSTWSESGPDCWTLNTPSKTGWEVAHTANMNMAFIGDTLNGVPKNDALAFFVRNVGGEGPYYAYASQQLSVADGDYWIQVHGTMFGEYGWLPTSVGQYVATDALANAMAWYGIGDTSDPSSVTEWRELYYADVWGFDTPGVLPCYNGVEFCGQIARYESTHVSDGQYLFLKVGHKWDTFNVWTVFELDDIALTPLNPDVTADFSGLDMVGEVYWDSHATR